MSTAKKKTVGKKTNKKPRIKSAAITKTNKPDNRPITERVKSFEDAFKIKGLDPKSVCQKYQVFPKTCVRQLLPEQN